MRLMLIIIVVILRFSLVHELIKFRFVFGLV